MDLYNNIQEAVAFIRRKSELNPSVGIILGTGLGGLVDVIDIDVEIPYREIPHFPVSTVESHQGKLMIGHLSGKCIMVMSGRFHFYEGYSGGEITFPVRVMKAVGISSLIISNAAGGLNPHHQAGQIVLVNDHINLMPEHPLRGKNDERLGVRFPAMKDAYPIALREKAHQAAQDLDYDLQEGVYVGLQGPSLETPAEYKFLNRIGGDMVGMSTVPEVIVAKHCELPVIVLSLISNVCYPLDRIKETSLQDVIEVVGRSAPIFCKLVEKIVARI